jgi:CDP-paratose 2-epimerase
VIGGAGFIGSTLSDRLAASGQAVRVYDNLSRAGGQRNLEWLRRRHGDRIEVRLADARDRHVLRGAVKDACAVYHLAAQVAVTNSLDDPRYDFDVNLRGTFELLEALRECRPSVPLIFTSTNKVYGGLGDLPLGEAARRWYPLDPSVNANGIAEDQSLSFHSPYGCSKGAADQYVLDYARVFGLRACVFRMSCIYGPRQRGTEDQGWVAHFLRCAVEDRELVIFGDGKQVRDVLYIDDLLEALLRAWHQIDAVRGRAFNVGGGPASTLSLLELLQRIERMCGRPPRVAFADWRPADQRYYVSDTRAFTAATGWSRKVSVSEGLRRVHDWLRVVGTSVEAREATYGAGPRSVHA